MNSLKYFPGKDSNIYMETGGFQTVYILANSIIF